MHHNESSSFIRCANCGSLGHVYRNCSQPIASYGVICCRHAPDGQVQYLMIQRRNSLSYVEFLRGKYRHENRGYIQSLLSNMTHEERGNVGRHTFDDLWNDLWRVDQSRSYQREYADAKARFVRLSQGYLLKNERDELQYVDIHSLLAATSTSFTDPEWGFPKGRRNINEADFACALREFREETGVPHRHVYMVRNVRPFQEVFMGMNRVRYKHVYFLATYTGPDAGESVRVDPSNHAQMREVKDVAWFNADEVRDHIRTHNVERLEMFDKVRRLLDDPNFVLASTRGDAVKGGRVGRSDPDTAALLR